jgi:hypothetical protein
MRSGRCSRSDTTRARSRWIGCQGPRWGSVIWTSRNTSRAPSAVACATSAARPAQRSVEGGRRRVTGTRRSAKSSSSPATRCSPKAIRTTSSRSRSEVQIEKSATTKGRASTAMIQSGSVEPKPQARSRTGSSARRTGNESTPAAIVVIPGMLTSQRNRRGRRRARTRDARCPAPAANAQPKPR